MNVIIISILHTQTFICVTPVQAALCTFCPTFIYYDMLHTRLEISLAFTSRYRLAAFCHSFRRFVINAYLFTRHTLVWQGTKFAFCPVFFAYRYLDDGEPIVVTFCMMWNSCVPDVSSPLMGNVP